MMVRMRRPAMGVTSVVLIAAIALGLARLVQAQTTPTPPPWPNPDAHLSTAQRIEIHAQHRAAYAAELAAFIADVNTRNLDLRSLPRTPVFIDYFASERSLGAAAGSADLIIVGTAKAIWFQATSAPFVSASVTVAVDHVVKGEAGGEVVVGQMGGPEPHPDADHPRLGVVDADPILLPGDVAVLFLQHSPYGSAAEPRYYAQAFTGQYRVAAGRVFPTVANPFGATVEGQPLDDFVRTLSTSAGR